MKLLDTDRKLTVAASSFEAIALVALLYASCAGSTSNTGWLAIAIAATLISVTFTVTYVLRLRRRTATTITANRQRWVEENEAFRRRVRAAARTTQEGGASSPTDSG